MPSCPKPRRSTPRWPSSPDTSSKARPKLAEFDTHGATRSWTPTVGDAAAVIRHLYQDSGGVVRIEHEGGVKVTAVHKTVIRTSDGRAWNAVTKILRSDDVRPGTPYLTRMS